MALTLDATLLAAQSSQTRHPICDLIVRRSVDDLPLPKNPGVSPVSGVQTKPTIVYMPDGRVAVLFFGYINHGNAGVRIVFSDVDRTAFGNYIDTNNQYTSYGNGGLLDAVPFDDLGNIGVVVVNLPGWSQGLYWMKLNSSGIRTSNGWILEDATEYQSLSLVKKSDGTFVLVYVKPGNVIAKRTSANFANWSAETIVYGG
ncbi:MAG: hypothetical protein AB9919_06955 [Geobacteraceae bacterium]